MKKFLVIYHVPMDEAAMQAMANASPEDQAKGMQEWMNWGQRTGSQLLDMGAPLANGVTLSPDGSSNPSTLNVSGYSIVEAEDMDHAKKLFENHPHTNGWNQNATIEIHETQQIPGM